MGNLQNNIPENDLAQRCHAGSLTAGVQYFISMTKTQLIMKKLCAAMFIWRNQKTVGVYLAGFHTLRLI